jgi:hypothetical protein
MNKPLQYFLLVVAVLLFFAIMVRVAKAEDIPRRPVVMPPVHHHVTTRWERREAKVRRARAICHARHLRYPCKRHVVVHHYIKER